MSDKASIKLLETIWAFPPAEVYSFSDRNRVIRGYDYYREQRVRTFEWFDGDLIAHVHGQGSYTVEFQIDSDEPGFAVMCGCPDADGGSNCKHMLAALFTIINLGHAQFFKEPVEDEILKEKLRKQLCRGMASSQTTPDESSNDSVNHDLSIELNPVYETFRARIFYRGLEINEYSGQRHIPQPLLEFMYSHNTYGDNFVKYLLKNGQNCEIRVRLEKSEGAATWEKKARFKPKLQFSLVGQNKNEVRVEKLFSEKNKIFPAVPLGNTLMLVEQRKLLCRENPTVITKIFENFPKPASQWSPYRDNYFRRDTHTLVFKKSEFNFLQLLLDGEDIEAIKADLLIDALIEKPCTVVLHAMQTPGVPQIKLIPRLKIVDTQGDLILKNHLIRVFDTFAAIYQHMGGKKRKKLILQATFLFSVAATLAERQAVVGRLMQNEELARFHHQKSLTQYFNFLEQLLGLKYLQLSAGTESFYLTVVPWKEILISVSVPCLLTGFDEESFPQFFHHDSGREACVEVAADNFYRNLSQVQRELQKQHIELEVKNKKVEVVSLEIAMDAVRKPDIDWFELKPEIKVAGKTIPEAQWQKILSGEMMLAQGDTLQVFDVPAVEMVDLLKKYIHQDPLDKKNKTIRVPRLRILDWIEFRKSGMQLTLPPEDEAIVHALVNFKAMDTKDLPKKFQGQLREYQKAGYDWLAFMYEHKLGACLADDMGLGKTIQAIAFLGGLREGKIKGAPQQSKHLLVLPPSLLFNWRHELQTFYPQFTAHEYIGASRSENWEADIILTTYEIVRRDIETFSKKHFDVIIFDEAQAVKNIEGKRANAVRLLRANFKLCLTGTPLENHLGEYFAIMDLALPGLISEAEHGDYNDAKSSAGIIRRAKPFVLRRTKEKILLELPPKIEQDVYMEMNGKQKVFYQKMVSEVKGTVEAAYRNNTAGQAGIIALTALLRLRQICASPAILDKTYKHPSPKMEFLAEKLLELQEEGHASLVFSQFTAFLDLCEATLKKSNIKYIRMDGKTPTEKRKDLVSEFQTGEKPCVFLISLKTGGVGLNLTRAGYVFHLDPWWNPAVENQASDRAHRMGQKQTVMVTRLLMKHTIEEKMMLLKDKKKQLFNEVMNESLSGTKVSGGVLSRDDFEFLIS